MKPGDVVMFTDEGTYAKWFFGQLGIVESVSALTDTSKPNKRTIHCRVKWLQPVKYHDRFAKFSDFEAAKFEVVG